ncbi:MAG TPA: NUDIX hydrolase [Bryobacteraceae bacterium]|nr:NUDIX hydrolase [Bryobacteraceae bacterium]
MKTISSKELIRTPILRVTMERAIDPDGFEIKRAIVQHRGSAVMMPVDERERILLVRQYRLPARQYLWELPAGRLDEGETPLQAAKRELAEETGYRARRWKKLAEFYPSPGFLAEKMTIYLATGLKEGEQTPMEDERIQTRWFSASQIDEMIERGKIRDGKTMIGFFKWRRDRTGNRPGRIARAGRGRPFQAEK